MYEILFTIKRMTQDEFNDGVHIKNIPAGVNSEGSRSTGMTRR